MKSNELVFRGDSGELFTTSILIAKIFQKRHLYVIAKIKSTQKHGFSMQTFVHSNYIDSLGTTQ